MRSCLHVRTHAPHGLIRTDETVKATEGWHWQAHQIQSNHAFTVFFISRAVTGHQGTRISFDPMVCSRGCRDCLHFSCGFLLSSGRCEKRRCQEETTWFTIAQDPHYCSQHLPVYFLCLHVFGNVQDVHKSFRIERKLHLISCHWGTRVSCLQCLLNYLSVINKRFVLIAGVR